MARRDAAILMTTAAFSDYGEQPPSLHFEPVSAEMGHTFAQLKSSATS